MFEVRLFQNNQNTIPNEFQISENDLSVLDASKYNIIDKDEIAIRKKEVLAVIDKITVDKLVLVFTRVFANILTSNENKKILKTIKRCSIPFSVLPVLCETLILLCSKD